MRSNVFVLLRRLTLANVYFQVSQCHSAENHADNVSSSECHSICLGNIAWGDFPTLCGPPAVSGVKFLSFFSVLIGGHLLEFSLGLCSLRTGSPLAVGCWLLHLQRDCGSKKVTPTIFQSWNGKNYTLFQTESPISRPCSRLRGKNYTLLSSTSPYNPYMGVPPCPGGPWFCLKGGEGLTIEITVACMILRCSENGEWNIPYNWSGYLWEPTLVVRILRCFHQPQHKILV